MTAFRALRLLKKVAFYAALVLAVVYTIFPYYWAFNSSFKSGAALFESNLIPSFDFVHYRALLADTVFLGSIVNSVIVATSTTAISLFLATTASYALGRLDFRGKTGLLLIFLSVSMFPHVAVLSGMFELIRWLGLYNHIGSLVLAYLIFTLPFTIWVLTSFMREFPRELGEAARIDGCSHWRTLTRIYFPLMGPALASTGLLAFIAAWNEFLFALTFILTDDRRTVPVAIGLISGSSRYEFPFGPIMAASVTVTLPLIILVLVFQRKIVAGLTAGAVKG